MLYYPMSFQNLGRVWSLAVWGVVFEVSEFRGLSISGLEGWEVQSLRFRRAAWRHFIETSFKRV